MEKETCPCIHRSHYDIGRNATFIDIILISPTAKHSLWCSFSWPSWKNSIAYNSVFQGTVMAQEQRQKKRSDDLTHCCCNGSSTCEELVKDILQCFFCGFELVQTTQQTIKRLLRAGGGEEGVVRLLSLAPCFAPSFFLLLLRVQHHFAIYGLSIRKKWQSRDCKEAPNSRDEREEGRRAGQGQARLISPILLTAISGLCDVSSGPALQFKRR